MSSRLANFLQENCKIATTDYFWSDSTITLQWINGSLPRENQFVCNRVQEIHRNVGACNWAYTPSASNPADLLTRGISPQRLQQSELWWHGPPWLAQSSTEWPSLDIQHQPTTPTSESVSTVLHTATASREPFINMNDYSSISRLHRITAWVMRFINNSRQGTNRGPLTAPEIYAAERYWIRHVQLAHFATEIQCLSRGQPLPRRSIIRDLRPFIDNEDVLRLGGRLNKSPQAFSELHPILMPANSHYGNLLILEAHRQVFHSGLRDTMVQLRERFWIIRARQRTKQLIGRCVTCRKSDSRAADQIEGQLPADRVTPGHPFQVIGVDFAGPLTLLRNKTRSTAFMVLFTCATTRAVHIELCEDCSAVKFLQAFRRFSARRGICHTIYSDNAKSFKAASKEFQAVYRTLKDPLIHDYTSMRGIRWCFIAERAPWWGGFYERLIRSVKSAIAKTISRKVVDFGELQTLLTEIEAMINSRPLTFVYCEDSEPIPLTPAAMIMDKRPLARQSHDLNTSADVLQPPAQSARSLRAMWNQRNEQLDALWKRWQREYLRELRSAHHSRDVRGDTITVGDLVIIEDPASSRLLWKLGVVQRTIPGTDGRVRTCLIRTANQNIIRRTVQHLHKLEIQEQPDSCPGGEPVESFPPDDDEDEV